MRARPKSFPARKAYIRSKLDMLSSSGGFYQDEEAMFKILSHGLGCKQCPLGSFVPEEKAPGKDRGECQACPEGK